MHPSIPVFHPYIYPSWEMGEIFCMHALPVGFSCATILAARHILYCTYKRRICSPIGNGIKGVMWCICYSCIRQWASGIDGFLSCNFFWRRKAPSF